MLYTQVPKGLSEAWIEANVDSIPEGDFCDYCGLSEGDGDFTFTTVGADTLCQYCVVEPFGTSKMCLAVGVHQSLCDCACGVCD